MVKINLVNKLTNKVELWKPVPTKNEIDEDDYEDEIYKKLWAEIVPEAGNVKDGQSNTIYAEISHKFVIRNNAKLSLSNSMYFIFNKQRYDIKYFYPNYQNRNRIEIFCNLIIE